jgi:RNA polymerase sigma-70 factor (ECF subfamily)
MNHQTEPCNDDTSRSEQFVSKLTAIQGALYAYISVLLGGSGDTADVLQETNLVLWRRAHEFDVEKSFAALAYRIAFNQVLAYRKKKAQDRHLFNFSENAIEAMTGILELESSEFARQLRLLDECIAKLPDYQREMIRLRYAERLGVKTISHKIGKSENSISTVLHRARQSLADCVETAPARGGRP